MALKFICRKEGGIPTLLAKGYLKANDGNDAALADIVPIQYILDWIRSRQLAYGIKNRLLVVKASTGSSKSTAMPMYIYKTFLDKDLKIAVTQPKVVNAVSIVRDLLNSGHYPELKLGENIGWQTGPMKKRTPRGITYMTIGILARQLQNSIKSEKENTAFLQRYRFIIIDEVHEQSKDMALSLSVLKTFIKKNADNPKMPFIIFTSATFDADKFLKYYEIWDEARTNLIQVEGFGYKKTAHFLERDAASFISAAAECALKIHKEEKDAANRGDILIFMPGAAEMAELQRTLQRENEKLAAQGGDIFAILMIERNAIAKKTEDFLNLFELNENISVDIGKKKYTAARKIIISTSVLETGVTIESLKYTIDCGYSRYPFYNPHFDCEGLLTGPETKSRLKQRAGRVGRVFEGEYYLLFTDAVYNKLRDEQFPEIMTTDISEIFPIILNLYGDEKTVCDHKHIDISKVDLLDMPPQDTLHKLFYKMFLLGIVNLCENTGNYYLTDLGQMAVGLDGAIRTESFKMVMAGFAWGASILDLISIAVWLSYDMRDLSVADNPAKATEIDWAAIYEMAFPQFVEHIGGSASSNNFDISGGTSSNLFDIGGGGGNDLQKQKYYYRLRLTICDDFIEGVILIEAFKKYIAGMRTVDLSNAAELFCEKVGIKYDTFITMLSDRDEICDNFIDLGVDISSGPSLISAIDETDFIRRIKSLKHCIYEGFKNNLIEKTDGEFYEIKSIKVKIPNIIADNEIAAEKRAKLGIELKKRPRFVLYDAIGMKQNRKPPFIYDLFVKRISVLDGFISPDINL